MVAKSHLGLVVFIVVAVYSNQIPPKHNFPSIVKQVINATQTNNTSAPHLSLSEHTRIIGGVETARNEFPFIVSFAKGGNHFCGGAVISPDWVLTAAHCASDPDFTVTAGEHDLDKNEGTEQKSQAVTVIRHPKYNPVTFENDICLVKVSPPFKYNNFVEPFAVPSTHYVATGNATVAGWGTEDEVYQQVSPVLRKVTVPIVGSIDCARQYGKNFISHIMICAGEQEGGKDACQGDSGGPLMCDDYHKGATLCGIVSFGYGCARPDLAGVYTKVAYYSDWIKYEIENTDSGKLPTRTTSRPRLPQPATTPPAPPLPDHKPIHPILPPGTVIILPNGTYSPALVHREPKRPRGASARISSSLVTASISSLILLLYSIKL